MKKGNKIQAPKFYTLAITIVTHSGLRDSEKMRKVKESFILP